MRGDLNKTRRNIQMLIHSSEASKFPTEFIHNNIFISGTKNISVTFTFFLNVAVKLADKIKPSTVQYDTFLPGKFKNSLYFYPTDSCVVMSVCNTLKIKAVRGMIKLFLG